MIPTTEISGGMLDALIVYVAILGILLLIATWLRLKIPILKKYHIPAALIAGIIGLILGPHFIGLIPSHITACWSALSGRLIVFVFAPMLMGSAASKVDKGMVKKLGGACCLSYALCALQYAIPILLCVFVLTPVFNVNPLFGTIVEQGWAGGHGTAGGMALVFEELGWMDGQSLAVTSATIGLVFGIVGGVVMINIGIRKGWTAIMKTSASIEGDAKELYPDETSKPLDTRTAVAPGVVDNFAFHAALISVAVLIGWIINWALKTYLNFSVSWFVTALFGGLLLWQVIKKTPVAKAVDQATFSRIQGISLEFLVAGAVASVNVPVVVAYAMPLIIQQTIMCVLMWFMMMWYVRRLFGTYWFENSMVYFGTFTGVAATGLLLLKTCDPKFESDASTIFAARSPFCSWAVGGGILTSMTPVWVAQYGALPVGAVYFVALVIALVLPILFGCWHPVDKESA